MKAFAGDIIYIAGKSTYVYRRVENTVEKGEKGYQHFLFLPQCFFEGFFLRVTKSRDCVVKG